MQKSSDLSDETLQMLCQVCVCFLNVLIEHCLLNRYLEYTLNANLIRKQDATSTIVYIASNVVGQPLAWDFMRANWAYIFNS